MVQYWKQTHGEKIRSQSTCLPEVITFYGRWKPVGVAGENYVILIQIACYNCAVHWSSMNGSCLYYVLQWSWKGTWKADCMWAPASAVNCRGSQSDANIMVSGKGHLSPTWHTLWSWRSKTRGPLSLHTRRSPGTTSRRPRSSRACRWARSWQKRRTRIRPWRRAPESPWQRTRGARTGRWACPASRHRSEPCARTGGCVVLCAAPRIGVCCIYLASKEPPRSQGLETPWTSWFRPSGRQRPGPRRTRMRWSSSSGRPLNWSSIGNMHGRVKLTRRVVFGMIFWMMWKGAKNSAHKVEPSRKPDHPL
jgi:hypothetical protein